MGFLTVGKFGTAKRNIPFKQYLLLVGFFWTSSVANNYAFDFNISMPLHMIFRAGSLIANMAMGVWILKKRYAPLKYLAIFMISVGICICTIQSSGDVKGPRKTHKDATEEERLQFIDWLWWCLGIAILTFALFVSARLGIFQESLYSEHGKHPWEALFYTHLLPLVFWLPTAPNLTNHVKLATETPVVEVLGVVLPRQVLWLALYVMTQGLCIIS
ncbi:UDP-galactose transporter [Operophtera brumata]|uniref:UDP-galactose transporter n=1 Tax=Operophtera brumata TaxID=104452 RepID=A0A0L7LUG4_OPEBR|nr:UDP-galactose transporter [Operophtera brumata]